jgi:hypothetical protein
MCLGLCNNNLIKIAFFQNQILYNSVKKNKIVTMLLIYVYKYYMSSVSTRLWNLQDNCQFYQKHFRTFFNNLTNLYKVLLDNLRNIGTNVLRPLPSWIIACHKFYTDVCHIYQMEVMCTVNVRPFYVNYMFYHICSEWWQRQFINILFLLNFCLWTSCNKQINQSTFKLFIIFHVRKSQVIYILMKTIEFIFYFQLFKI